MFKCFLTQILRFEEWRQLLWHTGHGGYCDRKIYSAAHLKMRFCCPEVIHVFAIYSDIISCGLSSLWPFWLVVVSVCGGFGLWSFRFVAVSVCGRFGLWPLPFWFVAVSVVFVSVCDHYIMLPVGSGHTPVILRSWKVTWISQLFISRQNSPTLVCPMRTTPIWDISHLSHLPTNHEQPCNCCIIMFQRISSYPSGHWLDIIT